MKQTRKREIEAMGKFKGATVAELYLAKEELLKEVDRLIRRIIRMEG